MKTTIKLFLAASVVAFAASCSSKPAEQEAATTPETEQPATPSEEAVEPVPAENDTTQVAQ